MSGSPDQILHSVFGFDAFRGDQAEVVNHMMGGGDALVLMPTGGGKSLCYQIPALCRDGVAIVVSPLIALMQDQVEALRQLGVRAAAFNSSLSGAEANAVQRAMQDGEIDLVYVAPERLMNDWFLELLDNSKLSLFAIDEAHCVSQWGHDFRPEYQNLSILATRYSHVPRLALTATADEPTRKDILDGLHLGEARVFVAGFDRPNIRYRVGLKDNPKRQLISFIKDEHAGESGIVYCLSRKKVEATAEMLRAEGFNAYPYHAGLDQATRAANQDKFLKEDGVIMAATIAFGMGIDKPDVRFVAHMDLPKSLEAYYQETGRAGRDGLPSDAWMVFGMSDVAKLRNMVMEGASSDAQKRIEHQKLDSLLGYCETIKCRRQVLLDYFGDVYPQPCGNCDTCLNPVDSFDGTEAAQKFLSAVYRTGERFGAAHVIDVLTGKQTDRVSQFGHDNLPTYGVGKDLDPTQWKSVARQLAALGLVVVDVAGHGGLFLGPDCREVLRGERKVELRQDPAKVRGKKAAKSKSKAAALAQLETPREQELFDALRAKRMELAQAQNVPPYVIFHDSTLIAMAVKQPQSLNEMVDVSGVGESKLKRYGQAFLDVVTA